ncbi:hypothetical protein KR038_003217 [Drosophila bunnanda]|nr:hypothetical protein KR038_003217 [Drosophila bunnanda]
MRILSILIFTWVVAHLDQVSGKKALRKGSKKGGPCGKPFLKQVNGRCYYMGTKKINWFGAQNNCLRKELNLADVGTPGDFKAITDFLKSEFGNEDYWIGGNDLDDEGHFNYISSGRLIHYMGDSGMVEPTLRSNMDDCLELRIRTNTTVMMDVNCHDKKYFICENSQPKCAQPTADDLEENQRHSHEHLHHFHHDAGKKEKPEAAKREEEVESDSRPLDNSNSTEIGTSAEMETTTGDPGEEVTGAGAAAGEESTSAANTAAQNATEEATTAGDPGATTAAGDPGATTAPGDAETTVGAAEESTTTTAPAA